MSDGKIELRKIESFRMLKKYEHDMQKPIAASVIHVTNIILYIYVISCLENIL